MGNFEKETVIGRISDLVINVFRDQKKRLWNGRVPMEISRGRVWRLVEGGFGD